jgi:alkylhydroperoxidase family enzyme
MHPLTTQFRQSCEALTHVDITHAPDAAYEPLTRHYDDKQVVNITYAIALMNAWNRIAIGFHQGPIRRG